MSIKDPMQRFNEKWEAVTESGCWIWTATTDGRYGTFSFNEFPKNYRMVKAHHVALYLYKGLLANEDQVVMHRCDNTFCCNPDHLLISTQDENMKDMAVKGRCKSGHKKLTTEQMEEAMKLRVQGMTNREMAKLFNMSESQMSRVSRGINGKKYS